MALKTREAMRGEFTLAAEFSDRPFGAFAPNALQKALIGLARGSFLRRGVFRPTICKLIMALGPGCLDLETGNGRYRLHGVNNLVNFNLLVNPAHSDVEIDFLVEGAPAGAQFVDIGSNIGLYALPLAKAAGSAGGVVAIDANPLMVSRLAWNAKASGLDNIKIYSCAVSDREGQGSLHIRKNDLAIMSVVEDSDGPVAVTTLVAVLADAGITRIHGLKIDIEGHEDKALVPYFSTASQEMLPQRIVIEDPNAGEGYPGCAAIFAKRGYHLFGRSKNNSLYLLGAPA